MALACPALAAAQSTAPSSITPPTLRPAPDTPDTATRLPRTQSLTPPPGAEGAKVTLDTVSVDGGFPELADETGGITASVVHRPVTLEHLYAAASAIEQAYARRGFVLVRVTIPPQRMVDGGAFTLEIVDGFIESIDVAAVPAAVRAQVALRAGRLIGRRHLMLRDIEQPLLLAGQVPGLALVSTLARGTQAGGTRLLLSGRHALVSGSLTVDNNLARALGRYAVTAQVSLNSVFGLGEQIYGFAVGGYDVPRQFRGDPPVRVLGGGIVVAPGSGRFSINPEVTFSRTQPERQAGVPATRGQLQRLSLRAGFIVEKTRRRTISLAGTIERIQESNDAIDFGLRLSLDRFLVTRLGATYSTALSGGGVSVTAQVSHGVDGPGATDLPPGVLPSRQGATPDFTKATLSVQGSKALGKGLRVTLVASGQTGFGTPLFRSEQSALEGADALSAYIGGVTAVDSAVVGRLELGRSVALAGRHPVGLSPYVFTAAGQGWIAQPTAIERAGYAAYNLGGGVRGTIAGTRLGFGVEYAHGFSADAHFDRIDRVAGSVSVRF